MHTAGTGPIKTIVALGFVVIIPLIAVFGLPERESVVASSGNDDVQRVRHRSVGVGESARYRSDDLFADFPHDAPVKSSESDSTENSPAITVSSTDPFESSPSAAVVSDDPFLDRPPTVPSTALTGWSMEQPETTPGRHVGGFASQFAAGRTHGHPRKAAPAIQPRVSTQGNTTAAIPGDATTARPFPREGVSPTRSGPKRYRHHRAVPSGGRSATPKDDSGAKPTVPQTWRAAVRRLNELGIHHFRLEPGRRTNEFHFHCSFTPSDTPRITQRFEAEAAEPLRAVQKVIVQVEQWLQRR